MDLIREKLRCTPMGAVLRKGGGSSNDESQTTTNTDRRAALQGSIQATEGSTVGDVFISSSDAGVGVANADAVKAIAGAGADVLKNVGGAIVDLNKDTVAAQTKSWDALVKSGGELVDKLIDANADTTARVVSAYKPIDGANGDVAKWGVAAAAAGAIALVLMRK